MLFITQCSELIPNLQKDDMAKYKHTNNKLQGRKSVCYLCMFRNETETDPGIQGASLIAAFKSV